MHTPEFYCRLLYEPYPDKCGFLYEPYANADFCMSLMRFLYAGKADFYMNLTQTNADFSMSLIPTNANFCTRLVPANACFCMGLMYVMPYNVVAVNRLL